MSIRNKYRTADIHDVMEIERNPNSEFDPEPTTLAAVCIHLFVADVQEFIANCAAWKNTLAIVDKNDVKYTYGEYYQQSLRQVRRGELTLDSQSPV